MTITLKTLAQATPQEMFEQVARHLLKQRKKSLDITATVCAYRSPEGLMCAAGCLIGDDEYGEYLENRRWSELVECKEVPNAHFELIRKLQILHDGHRAENWPGLLKEFAGHYGLDASFIESLHATS